MISVRALTDLSPFTEHHPRLRLRRVRREGDQARELQTLVSVSPSPYINASPILLVVPRWRLRVHSRRRQPHRE